MLKFIEFASFWFVLFGIAILTIGALFYNIVVMVFACIIFAVGSYCRDIYIYPTLATTKQIFEIKRENK